MLRQMSPGVQQPSQTLNARQLCRMITVSSIESPICHKRPEIRALGNRDFQP